MLAMSKLICALLLLPAIACLDSGFQKLTAEENEERKKICGGDGAWVYYGDNNEHVIDLISENHFLADAKIIESKYDQAACIENENIVTSMLDTTENISAVLLGECLEKPTGLVLADFHLTNWVYENYACILDEFLYKGDKLYASKDDRETLLSGFITNCSSPVDKSTFCYAGVPEVTGNIHYHETNKSVIAGVISRSIENRPESNMEVVEVTYLHKYIKILCEIAGICEKQPTPVKEYAADETTTTTPEPTTTVAETTPAPIPPQKPTPAALGQKEDLTGCGTDRLCFDEEMNASASFKKVVLIFVLLMLFR
ncbi:uncharacterized protein CELE_C46E10.1 [Caenorhabditis elegans]|uniref:Uncharacterized protein n=1 Tax=Caenorhabditis elegans TaxID=6239 RepID=O44718_CAEEL|nr:Uncharacterized protein CELE_C46E10.1 [Caenorhabditis elegans]CCD67469.1 Uncharacterized protein CELE_C46E10.1 [Caenorhabditis elegans]|eukprot:NP_494631.2 Uncharacterized protein CELE_C46E10.1 [Caenorhabditis elegans]